MKAGLQPAPRRNDPWAAVVGFGSPCLAAAVTAAAAVVTFNEGGANDRLLIVPFFLNATLAGLGAAAGRLRLGGPPGREVPYAVAAGVGGVVFYCALVLCAVLLSAPAM